MNCHDCDCKEGKIHKFDCDMERCPFCGNQLITCDCMYEKLQIKGDTHTIEHEKEWLEILEKRGRIPYIIYPVMCVKCGVFQYHEDLFSVPNEEWNKYIQPDMRGEVICKPCYDFIKEAINNVRQ